MKLELKHLAPYCCHKLMLIDIDTGEKFEIAGVNIGNDEILIHDNIDGSIEDYGLNYLKPILRPLSDLMDLIGLDDLGFLGLQNLKDDLNTINVMTFKDVQYLISKHYDVFGLIDQGLAIDINTL